MKLLDGWGPARTEEPLNEGSSVRIIIVVSTSIRKLLV